MRPPESFVFDSFFGRVSANPAMHARFLNTLSFMEYLGARRILRSRFAADVDTGILDHASEEIRHARKLKEAARRIGLGPDARYEPENLVAEAEARSYFDVVDRLAERLAATATRGRSARTPASARMTAYHVATLLIEERAMPFYSAYLPWLSRIGQARLLAAILSEEERHLNDVRTGLRGTKIDPQALVQAKMAEAKAFQDWLDAVAARIDGASGRCGIGS